MTHVNISVRKPPRELGYVVFYYTCATPSKQQRAIHFSLQDYTIVYF